MMVMATAVEERRETAAEVTGMREVLVLNYSLSNSFDEKLSVACKALTVVRLIRRRI
jgi:hypothetical protein